MGCKVCVARVSLVWSDLGRRQDTDNKKPHPAEAAWGHLVQAQSRKSSARGVFTPSNLVVTANSAIFRPMSSPAVVEKR
jgi:hypothetical protein